MAKYFIDVFIALLKQPEKSVDEERFPGEDRWWAAKERLAPPEEKRIICKRCRTLIGPALVKQCPGCGLVLHLKCYEDTEGGLSYQTPGCDACRHRCYWR